MGRLLSQPGYGKFWTADTVSVFGNQITQVALPVLALLTLHASDLEIGFLRAAQWAPYLAFGLITGVLVDRYPRKPILVSADLGRAALLALVAAFVVAGWMTMPLLICLMA